MPPETAAFGFWLLLQRFFAVVVRFILRNDVLLLLFVLLQRVLIQSHNVDFITPRGGA